MRLSIRPAALGGARVPMHACRWLQPAGAARRATGPMSVGWGIIMDIIDNLTGHLRTFLCLESERRARETPLLLVCVSGRLGSAEH